MHRVIIEESLKNAFEDIVLGMPFELDLRIADAWGTEFVWLINYKH
jgi:hypothetical protein